MARWILHVDNADEMAQWNKALTELMRTLARREAHAVMEGKEPSKKALDIVGDIDRYLSKHGYVTTKQLNVLVDIAKQNGVNLPNIPQKG